MSPTETTRGVQPPAAPPVVPPAERADLPGDPLPTAHVGAIRRFFLRHPRLMDVLVMAWFGIPAFATAALIAVPDGVVDADDPFLTSGEIPVGTIPALVAAVAVALGTGALWWRRQRPTLVLGVELVLAVLTLVVTKQTGGFEWAVAFALYALAAALGSRPAWVAFGAVATVFVSTMLLSDALGTSLAAVSAGADAPEVAGTAMRVTVWSVLTLVVLVPSLAALAIGVSVHNRRQYVLELVERAERLALEQDQREQLAVADERTRIARELHDVVAHSLTVMIALAEGAAGIAERDPVRAAGVMRDVAQTGRDALTDTRRVVGVLRLEGDVTGQPGETAPVTPADGLGHDGAPLAPAPTEALDDLVARFRTAGLVVNLVRSGPELPTDNALRLTTYRIVQESLTNVLRYAPLAAEIDVRIARDADAVRVEVTNSSGPGPARPAPGSGRGLIGMHERVVVFGGDLEAGPTSNGWRVRATIPWKDTA